MEPNIIGFYHPDRVSQQRDRWIINLFNWTKRRIFTKIKCIL